MADETMVDAPVTPAPIFAYRALRGIFFGSPDTPAFPTNMPQDRGTVIAARKSPTKLLQLEGQVKLTPPQKRKRDSNNNILSPTKSCLRTPGAVTPRRALLKDLTVTFKDPRLSTSPELCKKGSEIDHPEADKENQKPAPEKSATNTTTRVNVVSPVRTTRTVLPSVPAPVADSQPTTKNTATSFDFDLEEYMAKTDREMKKLIRYSRKMRDYARKQDDENVKLKELVEELKRENERLRRGETTKDCVPSRNDATRPTRTTRLTDKGNLSPSVKASEDDSKAPAAAARLSHDQTQLALDELLNLGKPSDNNTNSKLTTLQGHNLKLSLSDVAPNNTPTSTQPQPKSTQLSTIAQSPEQTQSHPKPTTTTRLASDRLAAARARIAKKAELRKSSAESGGSLGTGVTNTTSSYSKENSLVDWAAL